MCEDLVVSTNFLDSSKQTYDSDRQGKGRAVHRQATSLSPFHTDDYSRQIQQL